MNDELTGTISLAISLSVRLEQLGGLLLLALGFWGFLKVTLKCRIGGISIPLPATSSAMVRICRRGHTFFGINILDSPTERPYN